MHLALCLWPQQSPLPVSTHHMPSRTSSLKLASVKRGGGGHQQGGSASGSVRDVGVMLGWLEPRDVAGGAAAAGRNKPNAVCVRGALVATQAPHGQADARQKLLLSTCQRDLVTAPAPGQATLVRSMLTRGRADGHCGEHLSDRRASPEGGPGTGGAEHQPSSSQYSLQSPPPPRRQKGHVCDRPIRYTLR